MIMPMDKPDEDVPQAVLDEVNRRLAITMNARNAAPDLEMGGLSPDQVTRLIYSDFQTYRRAGPTHVPLSVSRWNRGPGLLCRVANTSPAAESEMNQLTGVGEKRLASYGKQFVDAVRAFRDANPG